MNNYKKFIITIFSLFLLLGLKAQPFNEKSVLFISSYNPTFPTFPEQIKGIYSIFDKDKSIRMDIEYMDCKRFANDSTNIIIFKKYLQYKLSKTPRYNLIIAADDDAFNFAIEEQTTLFKNIPIVFMGVNNLSKVYQESSNPMLTGVVENVAIGGTVQLMKQLFPKSKMIYAICDGTVTGLANYNIFYLYMKQHPKIKYQLLDLQKMTFKQLFSKLHDIPSSNPILLISAYTDKEKKIFSFNKSLHLITQNTSAPLFHLWYPGIGDGILGGMMTSHYDQGYIAGKIAMNILKGMPIKHIKNIFSCPNRYIFDYRQIQHFHINTKLLPKDSIIMNMPKSFYNEHKTLVWIVICVFLVMSVLILFLILNILRRRQISQQLIEETKRAQESDHMKSAFLTNISHEIRTPLNAIVGFSSLMEDEELTQDQRQSYNHIIQENNNLLLNLVSDTLILSRLESEKMDLHNSRFDFNQFLKSVIDLTSREALCKKLKINCQYTGSYTINSDKELLNLVITHLIRNAIKYTDSGTITIKYKFNMSFLTFNVIDTGIGISEEDKNKMFQRFEKLNTFTQGVGIGLSICKTIVNLLGGTIDFSSQLGKGTTFWFTIPCSPKKLENNGNTA